MPRLHRLAALTVAVVWGLNFLAIHASLQQFPPLLCAGMRWIIIAIPTVLFIPRPQVPLRWLLGYGAGFGFAQFAFLYWGMSDGMPTGLASLVLQSSAPFTVLLGAILLHERISRRRLVGVVVAVAGLAIVGSQRFGGAAWWPFVLTLLGGLGWAFGNLASRKAEAPNPLHLALWMTVVPPIPFFLLSLIVDGPDRIATSLTTSVYAPLAWAGMAFTCLFGTIVGSGLWTWLMAHHPASSVAPYSMLVPITGMTAAAVVLGETPNAIELLGAAVVIGGVLYGASAGSSNAPKPRGEQQHSDRAPVPG